MKSTDPAPSSPTDSAKRDAPTQPSATRSEANSDRGPQASPGQIQQPLRDDSCHSKELQELLESAHLVDKRFLGVLETLPPMIFLLTPEHTIAYANRSFRERFGNSQGRQCYQVCFDRTAPCSFCENFVVLETGQPHRCEVATPDGCLIDAYSCPFTDVDGTPYVLIMKLDLTPLRQAEFALKEHRDQLETLIKVRTVQLLAANSQLQDELVEQNRKEAALSETNERLRILTDNLPRSVVYQCIQEVGCEPRFTYLSGAVDRINGVNVEETLNNPHMLLDQIVPEDLPGFHEAGAISARDLSNFEYVLRTRMPDGSIRRMHLIARPRRLPNGATMWDGIHTDITDRKP